MELNWIDVAAEAAQSLVTLTAALRAQNTERGVSGDLLRMQRTNDDGDVVGYDIWRSPRTGDPWGQTVYLQVSVDGTALRLIGDDYQPWGIDVTSHEFAVLPATDIPRAAQLLCHIARKGFALDTLEEDLDAGRYVRGAPELSDLTDSTDSARYLRQRA